MSSGAGPGATSGSSPPADATTGIITDGPCDRLKQHTLGVLGELRVVDDLGTWYLVRTCKMRGKGRKDDQLMKGRPLGGIIESGAITSAISH